MRTERHKLYTLGSLEDKMAKFKQAAKRVAESVATLVIGDALIMAVHYAAHAAHAAGLA